MDNYSDIKYRYILVTIKCFSLPELLCLRYVSNQFAGSYANHLQSGQLLLILKMQYLLKRLKVFYLEGNFDYNISKVEMNILTFRMGIVNL